MNENSSEQKDESGKTSHEAWQEVGVQFQELGESLAQAFRTAAANEENRRKLHEIQTGLESMMRDVGGAIRDTAQSANGQQIREDAEKTAKRLADAGEQTIQEMRPELVNALRKVNDAIKALIGRMEEH